MDKNREQYVEELFQAIIDLPPGERQAALTARCGDDAELRRAVESLIAHYRVAGEDLLDCTVAATETLANSTHPTLRRVGRFHLKRVIASGGMGTVYEATQENPHRAVAVKLMKHGIASKSALRRFEYEAQILGRLRHSGIAQVYEAGTHRDESGTVPYFAMEYIPNASPITQFAKERKLGTRERMKLFAQVCDAVHHGHQKGIIHRDLKPGNILVDSAGQIKIIDFGVARATDSDMAVTTLQTDVGQLIGTLQYMSPEQCEADPHDIDTRSDVYALGVVFYELLCNKPPYDVRGMPIHRATQVIREEQPTRLSVVNRTLRGDVETIALKALEKERHRRYQSAADIREDINRYLNHQPITAHRPSAFYHMRVFARRNRALVAGVSGVFLSVLAGFVISTALYLRAQKALSDAETRRVHAEEIAGFLHTILRSVDPIEAQGRELTVKETLDVASQRIDRAFRASPLVEASLRMTMGESYSALGKDADAEPHLREALRIRREKLERNDPLLAESLIALGALLEDRGAFDEAEPLFEEALRIRRTHWDDEHPAVLSALDTLAIIQWRRGNYASAEASWREVMAARTRLYGREHAEVARVISNLAVLMRHKGDLADAERLQREALAIRRRLGKQLWIAESLNNLASILVDRRTFTEAEALYRESLEIRRTSLGEAHRDVAQSLAGLSHSLLLQDKLNEADPLIRKAIAMQREQVGESHPDLGYMLNTLGQVQMAADRYDDAYATFREALTILQVTLAESQWTMAWTRGLQGSCLVHLGQLADAEPLLLEAVKTVEASRGNNDYYTQELVSALVSMYDAWGAADKASNWRGKLVAASSKVMEAAAMPNGR